MDFIATAWGDDETLTTPEGDELFAKASQELNLTILRDEDGEGLDQWSTATLLALLPRFRGRSLQPNEVAELDGTGALLCADPALEQA